MKKALILLDLQYDFFPGGMNVIDGSGDILPKIQQLISEFDLVFATQLWFPPTHISFAANHLWRKPNQEIDIDDTTVLLQNMHCVANSFGAELRDELDKSKIKKTIQRGTFEKIMPHSAFFENDKNHSTGLLEILKNLKIEKVFIGGVNSNDSISNTTKESIESGFKTLVYKDLCAGMNEIDFEALNESGATILSFEDSLNLRQ